MLRHCCQSQIELGRFNLVNMCFLIIGRFKDWAGDISSAWVDKNALEPACHCTLCVSKVFRQVKM